MVDVFEEVIAHYTGVTRPERVTEVAAPVSPALREGHEPQRHNTKRAEDDMGKPVHDAGDEIEPLSERARAGRPAPPRAEQADERPGSARGGAPQESGSGRLGPAARVAATPAGAVQVTAAPAPMPPRTPRRRGRRWCRRRSLYSATFYILGAVRGGWIAE
jgi:hypothetical protein